MSELRVPTSSQPIVRALDGVAHRILTADVDVIRRARDAYLCPLPLLPFLAWHKGVDLWFEHWPEWKKRRITDEIYRLKAKKGVLPGIEGYLFYVDASVVDAVLPPQNVVARASDPERLKRFRAQFAELRITNFSVRGRRPGLSARRTGAPTAIAGRTVARSRGAAQAYGRQATIVDGASTTVIRSQDQTRLAGRGIEVPVIVLAIPGKARASEAIVGRALPGQAVAHSSPRGRILTLGADGIYKGVIGSGVSGLDVLDAAPDRVAERHGGLVAEPVAGGRYPSVPGRMVARASRAERYLYDRWHLFDEARGTPEPGRSLGPTVGRMFAELRPFEALLRIDARFRSFGRPAISSRTTVGRCVARGPSSRIDEVGLAITRAKGLSETIRFTTRTHRPIEIGDLSFERPAPWTGMVPISRSAT